MPTPTFTKTALPFLPALLCALLLVSGSATVAQEVYDANGNLVRSVEKGLDTLLYNNDNLVVEVRLRSKEHVWYQYDAAGQKVSQTVIGVQGDTSIRYYVDGIEYEHSNNKRTLKLASTEEGRLVAISTGFSYEYNLTDHLGSVRASFDTAGMVQADSYYPFGKQ